MLLELQHQASVLAGQVQVELLDVDVHDLLGAGARLAERPPQRLLPEVDVVAADQPKVRRRGLAALAVVRDLREHRDPISAEELEQFETDALAGFVLARTGLADSTIRGDVGHLEEIRTWFGRSLWDMEPADADAYSGRVLRGSPSGARLARSQALSTYFLFLELRHNV